MKPKQFAALALLAWIAVAGWVGSMILVKPAALMGRSGDIDTSTALRIEADLRRTDEVRAALAALRDAPLRVVGPSLIAVPPTVSRMAAQGAGEAGTGLDAPASRVLAFIVSGRGLRPRAMIDGTLVGPGMRLADGAIVRSIGARSVRIEDSEGRLHTLSLRTPGEAGARAEGLP